MIFVISFLNVFLPVLYLFCLIFYGLYFFNNDKSLEKYLSPALRTAIFFHFVEIVLRGIVFKHFPMAGIFEAASVLALFVAIIYAYIEIRLNEKSTGFFILVLVFSLQLISSAFVNYVDKIPEILHNPIFVFHTGSAILGYTGLSISALYSLMYLLLFKQIKKAQFGLIYTRLPSLAVLDEMNGKSAKIGLVFLSVAIVLGFFWSSEVFAKNYYLDPKIIIALATWAFYVVFFISKRYFSFSGKKSAWFSLSGFVMIVFSIMAVNWLFTSFHRFH